MATFSWSTTAVGTTPSGFLGYHMPTTSSVAMLVDTAGGTTGTGTATTRYYTSSDGSSWTTQSMTGLTAASNTRFGGSTGATLLINHVKVTGTSLDVNYGTDGVSWTNSSGGTPSSGTIGPVLYWSGPGGYVFGGGTATANYLTSNTASTFNKFAYSSNFRGGVSSGSVWLAFVSGSTTSYIRSTAPGTTWNGGTFPSAITASIGTAWNGNVFCVLGSSSSTALTSPDGTTGSWTTRTLPTSAAWTSVVACGTSLLALSNSTTAYQSDDDGATWSSVTLPSAAAYGSSWNGNYYLWSSTTGSSTIVIGTPSGGGGGGPTTASSMLLLGFGG